MATITVQAAARRSCYATARRGGRVLKAIRAATRRASGELRAILDVLRTRRAADEPATPRSDAPG